MAAVFVLAIAGGAWAFQELPPKAPVNDDIGAGIDRTVSVSGGNPTNADVVGGSLNSAKPAVPWAIFQQEETEPPSTDQIFVRSFAEGKWTTRGNGTVGGLFDESPKFPASLNFDRSEDGEVPAIDFAGPARTVPWATWYEETEAFFFATNIFASRFDSKQNKWVFAGQGRGKGTSGPPVPSLNINPEMEAVNPSVAGGSATEPSKPGPWITWQENRVYFEEIEGVEEEFEANQIYVERPEGPGRANCDGVKPEGVKEVIPGQEGEHVPAIGGFCWQQVGVPRFPLEEPEPSLNVDPSRQGVEPDIAFTGKEDTVPWVVWYEKEASFLKEPLRSNEMVFAAKGVKDGVSANGGFHWVAVGTQLSGTLDTSGEGTNKFGKCAESIENEEHCSLNKNPSANAEDPRVAAGTMNPANATVPWVAWDENLGGVKQIFVARLVEGTHFELANGGQPISFGSNDSTRPDITFSGNTPYVSWREDIGGGVTKGFYGHLVNAANPTFVLDESNVPLTPTGVGSGKADVREPISSGCIATPANVDGSVCQGGAVGTPFFLFTNGNPLRSLFADAYQPEAPVTGGASEVTTSSGVVSGAVNPLGASVNVFFEYGTSTAYGQATGAAKTAPNNSATPFAATLSGLPAGTTIHYRAVARSDFGTFVGSDQTFATKAAPAPPPPPVLNGTAKVGRAKVKGTAAYVPISCTGPTGATCKLRLRLSVIEVFRGHKLVALTARKKLKRKLVVVGSASVTLKAGQSRIVKISLNGTGRRLLAKRHKLKVRLRVAQTFASAPGAAAIRPRTVSTQILTFKARKRHKHHH
ncbi:MAG: hypothetical protein E6G34_06020 [Actinobacteria bacterium]|nr:MAG: hypothetical protein E6G34_06020 [Actinomycetota bacterium]